MYMIYFQLYFSNSNDVGQIMQNNKAYEALIRISNLNSARDLEDLGWPSFVTNIAVIGHFLNYYLGVRQIYNSRTL